MGEECILAHTSIRIYVLGKYSMSSAYLVPEPHEIFFGGGGAILHI